MHKKDVLNAGHIPLNSMEEMHYTNSDFNVWSVIEHLSGKRSITVSRGASIGSSSGSLRVAPLGYYANYPATAHPSLNKSRITGLGKYQKSISITLRSSMWSMMPPIFIRMGVC